MLTNLVDLFGLLEAGAVCIDEEQRGAFGAFSRVSNGGHNHQVGMDPVGDKNLGSVENPFVAVAYGIGANALNV